MTRFHSDGRFPNVVEIRPTFPSVPRAWAVLLAAVGMACIDGSVPSVTVTITPSNITLQSVRDTVRLRATTTGGGGSISGVTVTRSADGE